MILQKAKRVRKMGICLGMMVQIIFLIYSSVVLAQQHVEFTPSLSLSEVYEDNINLDNTNEVSDYITTLSPAITLNLLRQKTQLGVTYSPSFVWYEREEQNDTVRHRGDLTLTRNLTRYWTLELSNSFIKSEEPIEEGEEVEGVRRTRNPYIRNTGQAEIVCIFGSENALSLGYEHSYLKNDDPSVDDGVIQTPYAHLAYWFNIKNGIELDVEYTDAAFSTDDGSLPGDDYTGSGGGLRYLFRFNPRLTGNVGYTNSNRNFDGASEDYSVHEAAVGLEGSPSASYSFLLNVGYFIQDNETSPNENGYIYTVSITKAIQRGSLSIGGTGGWDEAYLESERRGFTRYWSADSRLEYQVFEPVSGYIGGRYRKDRQEDNREWETIEATVGMVWDFLRWFSFSLDYAYAERDDDVNTDDYTNNRVMVTLTTSRLFRW